MGSVLTGIFGGEDEYEARSPYEIVKGQADAQLQENLNHQAGIGRMQGDLAEALQRQMAGQGPNPAQIQYLANTGNNIANAQGLIASQRGLNPALAARLGANVAANENQRASLGSALLQQQQQLASQAQLQDLYNQMQQATLSQQGLLTGGAQAAQNLNAGVSAQNAQRQAQLTGGFINAIGGAGAAAAGKAQGGRIPGKAKVPGDSEVNDEVPAMLSPGEIVIPRSKAKDPDKAKAFIDHLMGGEKGKDVTYADVLKAKRKKGKS